MNQWSPASHPAWDWGLHRQSAPGKASRLLPEPEGRRTSRSSLPSRRMGCWDSRPTMMSLWSLAPGGKSDDEKLEVDILHPIDHLGGLRTIGGDSRGQVCVSHHGLRHFEIVVLRDLDRPISLADARYLNARKTPGCCTACDATRGSPFPPNFQAENFGFPSCRP
jgi:hypothetical protein